MKKNSIKLFPFIIIFVIILNTILFYGSAEPLVTDDHFTNTINAINRTCPKPCSAIRIMTYNLLADTPGFYGTPAYSRAAEVCRLLNTLCPDVAGLQESSRNWFYALSTNTHYRFISPLKTNIYGTMTTIIYNPHTLALEEWGELTFPGSHNGRLRRAVWGLFRVKSTNKHLVVINTHLSLNEGEGYTPLIQATELLTLCRGLSERYGCPLFLIGDFNSDIRSDKNPLRAGAHEIITTYFTDTELTAAEKIHGDAKGTSAYCVDHIFTLGEAQILRFHLLSQSRFTALSDHYPIFIDIQM